MIETFDFAIGLWVARRGSVMTNAIVLRLQMRLSLSLIFLFPELILPVPNSLPL